jgi:hypothetical protein
MFIELLLFCVALTALIVMFCSCGKYSIDEKKPPFSEEKSGFQAPAVRGGLP